MLGRFQTCRPVMIMAIMVAVFADGDGRVAEDQFDEEDGVTRRPYHHLVQGVHAESEPVHAAQNERFGERATNRGRASLIVQNMA